MIEVCAVISTVALVYIAFVLSDLRTNYIIPTAQNIARAHNQLLYIYDLLDNLLQITHMDSPHMQKIDAKFDAEIDELQKTDSSAARNRILDRMSIGPHSRRFDRETLKPKAGSGIVPIPPQKDC